MRTEARPNQIRTAAGMTAAAVLMGGLPLLTATPALADEVPATPVTQTVTPAKPAPKKLTKAQKRRIKAKRQRQRADPAYAYHCSRRNWRSAEISKHAIAAHGHRWLANSDRALRLLRW